VAVLRSRQELDDMHAVALKAQASPPDYSDDEMVLWTNGTVETLEWLLGRRPACPMTNTPGPVCVTSIEAAEARYAALVVALSPDEQAYGYGVRLTLSWALGQADDPPLP